MNKLITRNDMKIYKNTPKKRLRCTSILMTPIFVLGCSHFHLADRVTQINSIKLSQATNSVCAVADFVYEPVDNSDKELMSSEDLAKWNKIYFDAINLSDICKETIKLDSAFKISNNVDYLIDGKITSFYFKKNWVPVFFPLHLGLSFFTIGIYTLAAGPTTTTKVNFKFMANLKDAKTGKILAVIPEGYKSIDLLTIYSSDTKNPYGNPSIVFEPLIEDSLVMVAETIRKKESKKEHSAHY